MLLGLRDAISDLVQDGARLKAVAPTLPRPSHEPTHETELDAGDAGTPNPDVTAVTLTTTSTTTAEAAATGTTANLAQPIVRIPAGRSSHANDGTGSSPFLRVDKELPPIPRWGSVSFDLPSPTRPNISRSASALASTSFDISPSDHSPYTPASSSSGPSPFVQIANSRPKTIFTTEFPRSTSPPKSSGLNDKERSSSLNIQSPERARGLSFGARTLRSLTSPDSKAKYQNIGQDHLQPSPKPVARKSSFWRKNKPPDFPPPSPVQHVPLPTIVSPAVATPKVPPQLPPIPFLPSLASFTGDKPSRPPSRTHLSAQHVARKAHSTDTLSAQYAGNQLRRPSDKLKVARRASNYYSDVVLSGFEMPLTSQENASGTPEPHPALVTVTQDSKPVQYHSRRRAQTNPSLSTTPQSLHLDIPPAPSIESLSVPSRTSLASRSSAFSASRAVLENESSVEYLARVRSLVTKGDLGSLLASSSEPVCVEALRLYMREFTFWRDPLDIALRRLLMEVGLPRETQQIDRVIEAFSARYTECNPKLFPSNDQAYILAFSLIMLHTDAFNKSNKTKMTKADYVRNASLPGTYVEVLECFYDNIIFSPFIYVEDPLDSTAQLTLSPTASPRRLRTPTTSSTTGLFSATNKIDPYYLIANDLLESMQADLDKLCLLESPYHYEGTGGPWNLRELQVSFENAQLLQIEVTQSRPFFITSSSTDIPNRASNRANTVPPSPTPSIKTLKMIKAGILNRKDDLSGRGKKATLRKWKQWSVVLTGSQLLFFRDVTVATQLNAVTKDELAGGRTFRPDDILSIKDCVAVFDKSYTKHLNTFRFIHPDGRQILLQSQSQEEMNGWISGINYGSAFKSSGLRARPIDMSQQDMCLTGVAAATSHLHDLQMQTSPSMAPSQWDSEAPRELMGMLSATSFDQRPPINHRLTVFQEDLLDLDTVSVLESAKTEQFETTFKRVKADLRVHTSAIEDLIPVVLPYPLLPGRRYSTPSSPALCRNMRIKVEELEAKLSAIQSELEDGMRFLRNVAILRPLQKATRSRLLNAVQSFVASERWTALCLDAQRLACHIMILRDDLNAAATSFDTMQSIALDAAKQTLDRPSLQDVSELPRPISPIQASRRLSESTTSESLDSFHSATEYGSDWPSDDAELYSTSREPLQKLDTACPDMGGGGPNSVLDPNTAMNARSSTVSNSTGGSRKESDEKFELSSTLVQEEQAEQAEPWDRTRAAKRVSLINANKASIPIVNGGQLIYL